MTGEHPKPHGARDDERLDELETDAIPSDDLDDLTDEALEEIVYQRQRFDELILKEAAELAMGSPIEREHIRQASEAVVSRSSTADWSVANRRRIYLIRKQHTDGLSADEQAELSQLQTGADERMRGVAPRPLEELWKLRDHLRSLPPRKEDD